jgi:tRNA(Ile)-lysidine synthase
MLRLAYERVRGSRTDLTRDHLVSVDRLLFHPGEVHLPGGVRAIGEQGRLRLVLDLGAGTPPPGTDAAIPVALGETIDLPRAGFALDTHLTGRATLDRHELDERRETVFDFDALSPPLLIRRWAPGDRFTPLGMKGSQKVSDLFVNQKVPRSDRSRVPILTDTQGILWVIGHRRSDRARVEARTERILRVTVRPKGVSR